MRVDGTCVLCRPLIVKQTWLHSLERQYSNLAVENVDHVPLLVRYFEPETFANGTMPRCSKFLVHRVLDQLRSRLFLPSRNTETDRLGRPRVRVGFLPGLGVSAFTAVSWRRLRQKH